MSGFDTTNVTNMNNMFKSCWNLTSLDVSGFDTSNVTDMDGMFYNCLNLTSLDMSGFDTSNVTDMDGMFYSCSNLTSLDVSGFDTSNVTNMGSMFCECSNLTSLDLSGFDTSNVTDMDGMFWSCSNLTSLDVSGFDTSNVEYMYSIFSSCDNLTSIKTPKKMGDVKADLPDTFTSTEGIQTKVLSGWFTNTVLTKGTEPAPFPDIRPNPDPTPTPDPDPTRTVKQVVYRLYNPNSGEHLYTTDANETRTLSTIGWTYEGTAWSAPQSGVGVYRLYSPVTKMHLYTSDQNEVNTLVASTAWQLDNGGNPLFYTCEESTAGRISIYRLYNEQAQMHLLTTDLNEYNILGGQGWNQEGEKLSCLALGDSNAPLP